MGIFMMIHIILMLSIIYLVNCRMNADEQNELEARYGQEGTEFNDLKSCYRDCDGRRKICYYKFTAENFMTMGPQCGNCSNGTYADCFKPECISINGVPRSVLIINRKNLGPLISVCWNDELIIDVENLMDGRDLTIHWHGQQQKLTPFMDGVPMVTQCPFQNMNTFRYRFIAETPGTHWWHSHTGLQRSDGIVGQLIIRLPKQYDPNGNFYDFDDDRHAILINDWTNKLADEFAPGFNGITLDVDSFLLNGRGCYTDPNTNLSNCNKMPVATFPMQYGKSHRFRFTSGKSQNCAAMITIEGHSMTIIATDGYSIQPRTVYALGVLAGERYDAVLFAPTDRNIKEAIIRVQGTGACESSQIQVLARIVYVECLQCYTSSISDSRPYPNQLDFNKPLKENPTYLNNLAFDCGESGNTCIGELEQKGVCLPSGGNLRYVKPDREITLTLSLTVEKTFSSSFFLIPGVGALVARINNISYMMPRSPPLTQSMSPHDNYCNADDFSANSNTTQYCTHLIKLNLNEIVDFIVIDGAKTRGVISHPFHLHGHGFQVIDMGSKDQVLTGKTMFRNSMKPPAVKDVIPIPSAGAVRIRFRASNPGFWIMHCHFEWHMRMGMMMIIQVGEKYQMVKPPADFPKCGDYMPSTRGYCPKC